MSFQMLMSEVLRGLNWKFVLCYIDDILLFSKTFDEYLDHLNQIFSRLRSANLTLKPEKCQFGLDRVVYLGHVLSKDGVSVDFEKIEKVQNFPVPASQKDLKSFLGLCNYYRRFVKGYAHIVSPSNNLLKSEKKGKFKKGDWTSSCQEAFEKLKTALISPLGFPDMNKEFALSTDGSGSSIGYVLGQINDDGKEHVIAYGVRALSQAERKWSTTDLECLAVIEGIKSYRHYLTHKRFTVYSDHKALSCLLELKDPTGRLGRWNLFLQQYNMNIVHRAGKLNGNADALSRIPYPTSETINACQADNISTENQNKPKTGKVVDSGKRYQTEVELEYENSSVTVSSVDELEQLAPPDIATLQRQCSDFNSIIKFLETRQMPDDENQQKQCVRAEDQYVLDDNVLYHLYQPRSKGKLDKTNKYLLQLAVPTVKRKDILYHYHDCVAGGGHFGNSRTFEKIRQKYWWPKMYQEIKVHISSCDVCQKVMLTVNHEHLPYIPCLLKIHFQEFIWIFWVLYQKLNRDSNIYF